MVYLLARRCAHGLAFGLTTLFVLLACGILTGCTGSEKAVAPPREKAEEEETPVPETIDIEMLLPRVVMGIELDVLRFSSAGLAVGDETSKDFAPEIELVVALPLGDSGVDLQVGALHSPGTDWAAGLTDFIGYIKSTNDGLLQFDFITLGGVEVIRSIQTIGVTTPPMYYYPRNDVLFFFQSMNETLVAEAFEQIETRAVAAENEGQGASGQSSDPDPDLDQTTFIEGGLEVFLLPYQGSLGPHKKTCVGYPEELLVVVGFLVDQEGASPQPVPIFGYQMDGEVLIGRLEGRPFDADPDVHAPMVGVVTYTALRTGKEELTLTARMKPEFDPQLMGSTKIRFPVEICLNGLWQDGPRTLRVKQVFNELFADIESGTLVCGLAGQAFSGSISGNQITVDLKACLADECVGLVFEDDSPEIWTTFTGTVSDDGMEIRGIWIDQRYDLLDNDEDGEVDECQKADTQERSLTLTRIEFGPDTPWDE